MKHTLTLIALLLGMVIGFSIRSPQPEDPGKAMLNEDFSTAAADTKAGKLHAFFEREWDRALRNSPEWASMLGDRRWNEQWGNLSAAAFVQSHADDQESLKDLLAIDRARLTPADQLNFDLFRHGLEIGIEEYGFKWRFIPLTQRNGVQTADELGDALRFETSTDYEDWTERLVRLPDLVVQTIALMEQGISNGMLLPRVIMARVPDQIGKQVVDDPVASPFFKPFLSMPESISEEEGDRLKTAAREAIVSGVVPAYRSFKTFFEETYLPACPEEVGAWKLPDGEALYAFRVRKFTTTDRTPDEIHEIGLREVARIREQMETVRERVEFEGPLAEFFEHLRTDQQFYYQTGEELLAGYRAMSRRIDPLMVKIFRQLPRLPYSIEAIPDKIAPDTTTAYYRRPAADGSRAGSYFVNLYKPETRPKWEMMALSLHEAVPGHHLQIALAMELSELPAFRRYGGYTAFTEGWGLYSEHLGEELGLYEDPYDKFGQLTYEMWRAVRLVVDTGIHHKRWSRERAIQFFKDNTPKSELDITNEIDRYISWPGQALAYKIGELKIKDLRRRSEKRLGEDFDIREFHEVLLRNGAVPLGVLERSVAEWLEEVAGGAGGKG